MLIRCAGCVDSEQCFLQRGDVFADARGDALYLILVYSYCAGDSTGLGRGTVQHSTASWRESPCLQRPMLTNDHSTAPIPDPKEKRKRAGTILIQIKNPPNHLPLSAALPPQQAPYQNGPPTPPAAFLLPRPSPAPADWLCVGTPPRGGCSSCSCSGQVPVQHSSCSPSHDILAVTSALGLHEPLLLCGAA